MINIVHEHPEYSRVNLEAFRGIHGDKRDVPYLTLSVYTLGMSQFTNFQMNELTGNQLRELADKADEYWDKWQDYRLEQDARNLRLMAKDFEGIAS